MEHIFDTLITILAVSLVLKITFDALFDQRWYHKWLGKGVDGQPSRFFPNTDFRPLLAILAGIGLNTQFQFLAFTSILQQTPLALGQVLGATVWWDTILTGIGIGMGPKFWIDIGKAFKTAMANISQLKT